MSVDKNALKVANGGNSTNKTQLPTERYKEKTNEVIDTNYTVEIDNFKRSVTLKIDSNVIGIIELGNYYIKDYCYGHHLFKIIYDQQNRGKGYGKLLMQEYIKAGFPLPNYEYTRKISVIKFLEHFGYNIIGYVCDGKTYDIPEDKSIEEILGNKAKAIKLKKSESI